MQKLHENKADIPLISLALPIVFENLLRITLSSIDVLMLANFSETANAGVGFCGVFIFFLMLVYQIVANGSSTVISQYLGARKFRLAGFTVLASYAAGSIFAVVLSSAVGVGAWSFLKLFAFEKDAYSAAAVYMTIYGAGSLFLGINVIQSTIMRSYGYAKNPMIANMIANLVNIAGNYIALYGPFGMPVSGVAGVAAATVTSQAVACIILGVQISRKKEIIVPWSRIFKIPVKIYRQILKIGAPSAGEGLSYNISQIIIRGFFIVPLGTAAMNSNIFTVTILRYVVVPGLSIGYATQIKIGYLVGAGRFREAKLKMYAYLRSGYLLSLTLSVLACIFRIPLLHLFTHNPEIIRTASVLLFISIFREVARVANIIVIPGLKGAGDVVYPIVNGIIFQWLVGVGLSFLLGVVAGMGLAGIYVALACDEAVRSFMMIIRWRSDVWMSKGIGR